jgi:hypothetical protein
MSEQVEECSGWRKFLFGSDCKFALFSGAAHDLGILNDDEADQLHDDGLGVYAAKKGGQILSTLVVPLVLVVLVLYFWRKR